jgi:hypothetical protein
MLTLYMQQVLGYSAMKTGVAYLAIAATAIVWSGVAAQLVTRVGVKPVMVAGMVFLTAGLLWFTQVSVSGSYVDDLNEATTVGVDLNVLAERAPKIPESFRDSRYVFLANTHPVLQQQMLESLKSPRLIIADTMNLWIQSERKELGNLLKRIHGLVLNDGEARLLTEEQNLIAAAKAVLKMGPQFVVIKKGEHGSLMCSKRDLFVLPAFPAEQVVDPTGAGDSFAGGMMGYLATQGSFSPATIKRALAFGTVVASYTVSDFSLAGLQILSRELIDQRWEDFKRAMIF